MYNSRQYSSSDTDSYSSMDTSPIIAQSCPIIENEQIDSLSLRSQYLTHVIQHILQTTPTTTTPTQLNVAYYFWPTDISNFIITYIQEINEQYLQIKCNSINTHLTQYFTKNTIQLRNIPTNNSSFNNWLNYNPKIFIEYISFIIGRYAGGYGWDTDNHSNMHDFSHTSRIVYHTPSSYDVVCAIADEEIYSNCTNEQPLWYAEVFVQKKFDEMWIGVAWDKGIVRQFGWGIRHYKHMLCYYGGRENTINNQRRQWKTNKFDIKMGAFEEKQKRLEKRNKEEIEKQQQLLDIESYDQNNDNINNNNNNSSNVNSSITDDSMDNSTVTAVTTDNKSVVNKADTIVSGHRRISTSLQMFEDGDNSHLSFKEKYDVQWKEFKFDILEYTKEYNGRLVDCAPGVIQGYGKSPYQYQKAIEFYTDGDFVGVLVHGKERWVRFYCNGRFQGEKIDLPGEDENLGKRLWFYATTDSGTDTLVLIRKVWDRGTSYE